MNLEDNIHNLTWRCVESAIDKQVDIPMFNKVFKCVESSLVDYVYNQTRNSVVSKITLIWFRNRYFIMKD